MSASGEHEIHTHPRAGRRILVAGCIALGLFVVGLVAQGLGEKPGITVTASAAGTAP